MRTINLMVGAAFVASIMTGVAISTPETFAKTNNHKVAICHATASEKNPYVQITVDYNSIVKQGHDQHQDDQDIIPAIPEHKYLGKNLHLLSTLENDCKYPRAETPAKNVAPERPSKSVTGNTEHKYTICHATRSASNPYVLITVDYNSIIKMGHGSHDEAAIASYSEARKVKSNGDRWGDIIPAISKYNYAGLNWTSKAQAMLENGCKPAVAAFALTGTKPVKPAPAIDHLEYSEESTAPTVKQTPYSGLLPQTGISLAPVLIAISGIIAAGASYALPHLRRIGQ